MADYKSESEKKSMSVAIFTGGAFPAPAVTAAHWRSFPPDFVIAADSGAAACLLYRDFFGENFEPDIALGDFDSASGETLEKLECPMTRAKRDKDLSDTEMALETAHEEAARKKSAPFITIVGGDGGRIDHLLSIYDSFSSGARADAWLLREQKIFFIPDGARAELAALKAGDVVSVARLAGERAGGVFKTEGLKWGGERFRKEGFASLSNWVEPSFAESGKPVSVECDGSGALLIAPHSALVNIRRTSRGCCP